MTSFLLDTNVISELRKGPRAHRRVAGWDLATASAARFTSVIAIGELRKGAHAVARTDDQKGAAISRWIDRVLASFEDRILPVGISEIEIWAKLMVPRTRPPLDTLIAATALANGLTLVTRNIRDFDGMSVALVDPWSFDG